MGPESLLFLTSWGQGIGDATEPGTTLEVARARPGGTLEVAGTRLGTILEVTRVRSTGSAC